MGAFGMVRETVFPGLHARHSVCARLCGIVANGQACAVLDEARLAFWARLRQWWQGRGGCGNRMLAEDRSKGERPLAISGFEGGRS
jgi:hypothetical protein